MSTKENNDKPVGSDFTSKGEEFDLNVSHNDFQLNKAISHESNLLYGATDEMQKQIDSVKDTLDDRTRGGQDSVNNVFGGIERPTAHRNRDFIKKLIANAPTAASLSEGLNSCKKETPTTNVLKPDANEVAPDTSFQTTTVGDYGVYYGPETGPLESRTYPATPFTPSSIFRKAELGLNIGPDGKRTIESLEPASFLKKIIGDQPQKSDQPFTDKIDNPDEPKKYGPGF